MDENIKLFSEPALGGFDNLPWDFTASLCEPVLMDWPHAVKCSLTEAPQVNAAFVQDATAEIVQRK
jgi:hypothetical protein